MAFFIFDRRIISPIKKPWGFSYLIDLIKTITTQSDWQEGTLTDVVADSGDYLRLADTNVLNFDGTDDYVKLDGTVDKFHHILEGIGTISLWVNIEILNTGRQWAISANGGLNSSDTDINIGIREDDNWSVYLSDGNNYLITCNTSVYPEKNKWYHIVVVLGGEDRGLYIDTEKIDTWNDFAGNPNNWDNDLHFGFAPNEDRNWHGKINNIRIYNENLSQAEVQGLYNGTEIGGNLVGYWPINEGSGSTVYDESTNNNDGTIHGATWTTSYLFGNRTQQFDLSKVGTVGSSKISWIETLNSQNITIETRLSTDSGETWNDWKECTNGNPIPDLSEGTNVSNGLLECRQTLSTSDPDTTPELDELKIEVYT